ncbi:hypothetical protein NIES2100_67400 [Calothrix sp. NIES-2100]|uniref:hypothetical protein n=1 Tax=Calothrix sp. NIES-2100 TaxID=1954172 RepID=UPI000B5E863B|nr:hypothetical protein NIES2100_67400 [Calothrix sp. NIES-2100]
MSNITLEQEEVAVLTELDDEKTVALVGGSSWEPPKLPDLPELPELPDFLRSKGQSLVSLKLNVLGLINLKIKL